MAWNPPEGIGDEKSRFAVNARKYTHARAIATRPSSPPARGSLLGSESSIDSWQLAESPECREEDKQKRNGNKKGQSSVQRRKDQHEGNCQSRLLFGAEGQDGVDGRGASRRKITREEGYDKKEKASRRDDG